MKVLVACESSGTVRDAFAAREHDAWSCDILPAAGKHLECDVRHVLDQGWDLMIAHPPCTYLCVSGMHWTARGLRPQQLTEDALEFVKILLAAPIARKAIENPVGVISSRIRPPDQYIQPYQFGEDASKKTGLWLENLPKLVPTKSIPGRKVLHNGVLRERWSNQTDSGQNCLPPSADRWQARSKTYQGIANAMAEQWG